MKAITHFITAVFVYALYGIFAVMPVTWASGLAGWIGRTWCYYLPATRHARHNLQYILPHRAADHEMILRGMWDNFCRVFAEYPHLQTLWRKGYVTCEGQEHLYALRDDDRPGFVLSAHLANWEMGPIIAKHYGMPIALVYRRPNNRWVDGLLQFARRKKVLQQIPKGTTGAKALLGAMKNKQHVGILLDQKMNDGIAVPFLGVSAMTAPALAQLAIKYDAPIMPAKFERVRGCHIKVTLLPLIEPAAYRDQPDALYALTAQCNHLIGQWVLDNPQQWLWMHRRWPQS